ncbi:MAG: hypothetical protein LBG13_02120, partial [Holosporales bacterium]|nr:hypothetical protein [Holosporales bacterium]
SSRACGVSQEGVGVCVPESGDDSLKVIQLPAPVASFHFFSWNKDGTKFFLHKNKKACYNIIDTCSCGLCFPRELAGLARRGLVYASRNRAMIL